MRPASPSDDEFLLHVYVSTRLEEMASWGWSPAQQSTFIRMQFAARRRSYVTAYPSAEHNVILFGDVPAGSIIIFRGPAEVRLLDIALLPEFRGRGIARNLIGMLVSEAARSELPVRLSVLRGNPAARLYERLGFIAKGGDQMYTEMECLPARDADAAKKSLESIHVGKSE